MPRLNRSLAVALAWTTVLASAPSARVVVADGPIVRPIAWSGRSCDLEDYGVSFFTFTADAPSARIDFDASVLADEPECLLDPIPERQREWIVSSVAVLPHAAYAAHLQLLEPDEDELYSGCRTIPEDPFWRLAVDDIPAPEFVLRETFAATPSGTWDFGPGTSFVAGTGIRFAYADAGTRAMASVTFDGLTPGQHYAITLVIWQSGGHFCDDYNAEVAGEMHLAIETEPDSGTTSVMTPGPSPAPRLILAVSPNPFNPRLQVTFQARAGAPIEVAVHDVRGRRIAGLYDGHASGSAQTVDWNAPAQGSGVYFLVVQCEGVREVRKISALK